MATNVFGHVQSETPAIDCEASHLIIHMQLAWSDSPRGSVWFDSIVSSGGSSRLTRSPYTFLNSGGLCWHACTRAVPVTDCMQTS